MLSFVLLLSVINDNKFRNFLSDMSITVTCTVLYCRLGGLPSRTISWRPCESDNGSCDKDSNDGNDGNDITTPSLTGTFHITI
jgi:hypothetical protein